MVLMLTEQKLIGHAGNVIADDHIAGCGPREFFVENRHGSGRAKVEDEQLFQTFHGTVAVFRDGRMIVNVGEEVALESGVAGRGGIAEAGEAPWSPADILRGRSAGGEDALLGCLDQIGRKSIESALKRFVEFQFFARAGMYGVHLRVEFAEKGNFPAKHSEVEKPGLQSVVEIRGGRKSRRYSPSCGNTAVE